MRIELAQRLLKSHIPALDGIRGLSAFLVFCAHAGLLPRQCGALGVAIFFALSGFLITWLLLKENESTGTISLKGFYIRRTLRIFPAFYVFWLVAIGIAILTGTAVNHREVASSFFYLGDYYNALKSNLAGVPKGIMGITWSLGVEEKFYMLWPWIFLRYRKDLSKLLRIVFCVMGLVWLYRIGVCLWGAMPVDYLRYAFESRLDNIMYGCALAIIVKARRFTDILVRVTNNPVLPLLMIAGLAVSVRLEDTAGPTFHYVGGMTVDAVLITLLIAQLITLSGAGAWRWLDSSLLRFAGRISYSVYLYHFTVISLVNRYLSGARWSVQLIAALVVTVTLATLSYYCVELPFLNLKGRFGQSPHRLKPAAVNA